MKESTSRALLVAGLSANVLFLFLALLDYSRWDSEYQWPIFVAWAFVIILLVILALVSSGIRVEVVQERRIIERIQAPAPGPVRFEPLQPATPAPPPKDEDPFPFVYNGYTLYSRSVALKNGGDRTIWFFSKRTPSSGSPARKPAGYHVGVNERTGLPFLKRGGGKDGEDLTPAASAAEARPQCGALTNDGQQCRNSAREASKYCASHFGYQPPTAKGLAKRIEGDTWSDSDRLSDKTSVKRADTKPAAKRAADTEIRVRRSSS